MLEQNIQRSAPQGSSALNPGPISAMQPNSSPLSVTPFPVSLQQAQGFLSGPKQFAPYIEGLISRYSALNGLSPDLVRSVITQESDGNTQDVSHAGARGLMQLMPEEIQEFGITDPFDPEQNIAVGTRLLAGLLKKYKGDVPLALAAYNAGPGAVSRYNGVPPYPETQNYVKRIMQMLGQNFQIQK